MRNSKLATFGATALGLAALFGCNKGTGTYKPTPIKEVKVEEIKPDQGKELMPIKVGNQWTYNVESQQNIAGQQSNKKDTLTLTIVEIQPAGNGQRIVIQSALNGEDTDKQAWLIDDRGIMQEWVKGEANKYTPPQPNVMFPLTPGTNFEWKGTGPTVIGKLGTQSVKAKLVGAQPVDTDMGRLSAICVESDGEFSVDNIKGQTRLTSYWAKGIGLVRYRQETAFMTQGGGVQGVQLIKLKNYTLK